MKTIIIMERIDVKNKSVWSLILSSFGILLYVICIILTVISVIVLAIICGFICAPVSIVVAIVNGLSKIVNIIIKTIRRYLEWTKRHFLFLKKIM